MDVEHTFLNVASTMNYTGENADDDKFVDLTMQMNDLLLKYLALSVDNAALESDINIFYMIKSQLYLRISQIYFIFASCSK